MNHVAYLIPTIDHIGGAEQQVLQLAKGLARKGWAVSVIALSGSGGDAAKTLRSKGVAFHSLEMRRGLADPRGWLRLRAWMLLNHPDVVHTHLPHATLLARWSRLASPMRVVVDTIHSPATGGPARQIGYRLSTSLTDVVTAVSQSAAQPWLEAGLVDDGKLKIVPNGVDTDHWKPDDSIRAARRRELGLSDQFLWLAVGRLDPVKNHALLLQAFARTDHQARLVILGKGPLQDNLRSLAATLQVADRVTFPGFQSDVLCWMRAADGFVLCSSWEGLPMTLLEAGACELPAVITDIPGSREVLPDNLHATAAPVNDVGALSAAMNATKCLSASARRERGRLIRTSICARFDLDAVLTQWEDLYLAALARKPARLPSRVPVSALDRTLQFQ